jgi:hypothetical protein
VDAVTTTTAPRRTLSRTSVLRAVAATAVVLGGAVVVGGLSSPGQQYLPDWLGSLCNSAGGWSMFTFLLVWLSRARPALAAALGIVAFEGMVESYALVSEWRGYFYAAPFGSVWSILGLLAGPVIGLGAAFARYGGAWRRVLGVAPLALVVVAEGAYGLLLISDTTSPVYWTMEVVAGAVFLALALWSTRPDAVRRA